MSRKLLGLLLIAGGACRSASVFLQRQKSRICALNSLAAMLELMQAELQTSALPLAQLFVTLLPRLDEPARAFAAALSAGMAELGKRSFSEIWNAALHSKLSMLCADELQELEALGAVLGRYELSRQCEALSRCRSFLKQNAESAAAAMGGKARLAWGLALTGAALLGIVLI